MNYTENYQLPQWEETDRVLRTDFNDSNSKIDAALPRIITGNYIGTGEGNITKHYSLGTHPKMVIVRTENTYSSNTYDTGVIITEIACIYFNSNSAYMNVPGNPGALTEDGFTIFHDNESVTNLNREGVVQHYWALC